MRRPLFGSINKMTYIPSNCSRGEKEIKCQCGQREDKKDIYKQGLKSIGSMGALLPGRVPLARKVDQL